MKKLSVCFVLCSMLWTAICSAAEVEPIEVESSISAVNVFFQGARGKEQLAIGKGQMSNKQYSIGEE